MKAKSSIRYAAALLLTGTLACAHAQLAKPYVGASIGDTDLGTGLRAFTGASITNVFGWEAQLTSFGSRTVFGCKTSAWALGGGATARAVLSPVVTAYGKAGLHYVRAKLSGCASASDSDIEAGIGAGLLWNFSPTAALRVEFENIGGDGGDFISVGIQIPF
jgi:Outer membrane protein beta-barrel domain